MLIVQPCEFIETGDGYYRMHEPMRQLGLVPGIEAVDVHYSHPQLWPLLRAADVVVLPFFGGAEYFPLIEQRRSEGKVTVFETNDYFLDTQPWNPIYPYWQDPEVRQQHVEYIRSADAIQTSSPRLAEHWGIVARKTVIFRNHLTRIPDLKPERQGPLTIGWAGSQGHLADWLSISPLVSEWLTRHPEVRLAVMSHTSARSFVRVSSDRLLFKEAGAIEDYEAFLENIDIGLAPLLPTEYNRCRSDIKFLEYAARGIVGIFAALPDQTSPYVGSVDDGVDGFLYKDPKEIPELLEKLYLDPNLRQRMRLAAHTKIKETRRVENHITERVAFYRSLLPKNWTAIKLSSILNAQELSSFRKDQSYFVFPFAEAGHKLLEVLKLEKPEQDQQTLLTLVNHDPNYVQALQALGKCLNQLKKPEQAQAPLELALKLSPDHGIILCELARSYFLRGDNAHAFELLERAISLNPHSSNCWRYLLNFLRISPQQNLKTLLARLEECQPLNYSLWLQAIKLLPHSESAEVLAKLFERLADNLSEAQLLIAQKSAVPVIAHFIPTVTSLESQELVLRQAQRCFPDSAGVLQLRGNCLIQLGRATEAWACYAKLAKLKQQHGAFDSEIAKGFTAPIVWELARHVVSKIAFP